MKPWEWSLINTSGSSDDKLNMFISSPADAFAIFQLNSAKSADVRYEKFISLEDLKNTGKKPNFDHYDVVYVAPLSSYQEVPAILEELYEQFNINHPSDFCGHSMSVSDVIALKIKGRVTCYYVDDIGFSALSDFLKV